MDVAGHFVAVVYLVAVRDERDAAAGQVEFEARRQPTAAIDDQSPARFGSRAIFEDVLDARARAERAREEQLGAIVQGAQQRLRGHRGQRAAGLGEQHGDPVGVLAPGLAVQAALLFQKGSEARGDPHVFAGADHMLGAA